MECKGTILAMVRIYPVQDIDKRSKKYNQEKIYVVQICNRLDEEDLGYTMQWCIVVKTAINQINEKRDPRTLQTVNIPDYSARTSEGRTFRR